MNRRTFLQNSLAAAAGGLAVSSLPNEASANNLPSAAFEQGDVGVQLYTLRSIVGDDFPAVLKEVADAGYKYAEFAGYYDHPTKELRKIIDDLGLKAASGHFGIQMFADGAGPVLEGAHDLGMTHIIVPILPADMINSIDALKKSCAMLNKLGEECKNAGFTFGFHNHWQEFEEVEGVLPYDLLLSETEPFLVTMELDLAWAVRGGQDPIDLIKTTPGRYELFHLKDLTADGQLADVGSGTLDFPAIMEKARLAGLVYGIVEHDAPQDPVTSINNSYSYLKKIGAA